MIRETSAGTVLLCDTSGGNEFLLLNYPQGHWDFVKGKMEVNETPQETVRREMKEETGISNFQLVDGFEEYVRYNFRFKNEVVHKKVIFFLAKTNIKKISIALRTSTDEEYNYYREIFGNNAFIFKYNHQSNNLLAIFLFQS